MLHKQQVDDRQHLATQCSQVDSMYESLAAHEQKVNYKDSVKHDDLTNALANFQHQLTLASGFFHHAVWCDMGPSSSVFASAVNWSWN